VSPTDELNYINLNLAGKCKDKVPRNRDESPEGDRSMALNSLDLGTLERGGCSVPRPGRFTSRKDQVPIVQEAGWAPGPVKCGW
jgi:hypothetical protein